MARSTRTNYAKCKVWMPNMTSEFEGPRLGCVVEMFATLDADERTRAFEAMQKRDVRLCEYEAKRVAAAVQSEEPSNG